MSDHAITVENLTKWYRIGVREKIHDSMTQAIFDFVRSPIRNYRKYRSLYRFDDLPPGLGKDDAELPEDMIWALKDVSFSVQRGEVLGIIGRNGAGKSTLLKILSRITEPSRGRAIIRGSTSSLLEVGTGFHPELTGRENVYLNGIILGMKKWEVDARFDEIVAFSGVERFIDTPVKRYSSGMTVRLAFAVAAHLEPEILIIDEVLAVGDAGFQKKCLGKMEHVAREGRTVLFVSHNMTAVQSLCGRCILLHEGQVAADGPVASTVGAYLSSVQQLVDEQPLEHRKDRQGGTDFRFLRVEFLDGESGRPVRSPVSGQTLIVRLGYRCNTDRPIDHVDVTITFWLPPGGFLFSCASDAVGRVFRVTPGEGTLECMIPQLPLNSGRYSYNIFARCQAATLDYVREAGILEVEAGDFYGTGKLPSPHQQGVFVDYDWADGGGVTAQSSTDPAGPGSRNLD